MHTGYDNFWMYQNSRHEPVLSLPKNDNHSNAVLTDTYKQVLNGGSPNNFNSCIMPQNNVARSHHSDQHRIADSQYVWPSSVYSLPFRSSHANNFHSQESYPNQCSNLSYSSQNYQVQDNYDSSYLKNRNLNFSYVNNNANSDNNSHLVKTQNNENTNTSVARIRVKDVFTLNSNSVFGNSLFQTNQREPSECPLNYAITSNLTSCDSKMPSEYMDYEKINLLESSNLPSHYGHKIAEESHSSDQQEFLQHSSSFYEPNDQPSSEGEFQVSVNKEKNFSSDTVKTNSSLSGQLESHSGIPEPEKNFNDVQHGSKRIKVKPKRNSNELRNLDKSETRDTHVSLENCKQIHCSGLSAACDVMNNASTTIRVADSQTYHQENLSEIEKTDSLNHDSLVGKLRKWRKSGQCLTSNSDNPSQNEVNGQDFSRIKITIPHTGQSSFLHFKDSSTIEGTSNMSSTCLLESKVQLSHALSTKNPIHKQINTKEKEVTTQINQNNSISSTATLSSFQLVPSNSQLVRSNSPSKTQSDQACSTASVSPPKTLESVNESLHQVEVNIGFKNQKNSNVFVNSGCSENISENFDLKNLNKSKEISTEISTCHSITLNTLVIKQETSEVENSQEQCDPVQQVCAQIIKIEKNPEDSPLHLQKTELPCTENFNALEKKQLLEANRSENIAFNDKDAEKYVISSKDHEPVLEAVPTCALNNAENCIQRIDASKSTTEGKNVRDSVKSKTDSLKVDISEVPTSKNNYTSKINRDKLDLLIEFLNKEEDTVKKASTPEEAVHSLCLEKTDMNNKMKKEIKPSRNRRKLSKTFIVKNKNNSREMISLMSHKIAQVEIFKCSSETSQTVETNNNSDKSEGRGAENKERSQKIKKKDAENIARTKKSEEKNAENITSTVKSKEKGVENVVSTKRSEKKGAEKRPSIEKSEEKGTCAESRLVADKIEESIITNPEETISMKDKDFELPEKQAEINNPLQTLQTQKDPLIFDTKDINMPGNKKFQDTSKESSSGKECDIQEEENVINTMRAFQNFKTHFCMSCDLISGVDSFWINVVSGELRCLNCFKKMLLKAEDSILKLKAEIPDGNNDSDASLVQKSKPKQASENGEENNLKTGCENNLKNKNRLLDFREYHCGHKKVSNLKESIKQELTGQINGTAKDKIMNKSDNEPSFVPDFRRTEVTDCTNSSKRRIESRENNFVLIEKNFEKHELKMGESKNKLKEDPCRKIKTCENSKKQEMKEIHEKSRRKSFTKEDEIVKMQSPEWRVSSIVSKKNCSAAEPFPLNHCGRNALEGKNTLKKSVSPKFHSLESYKDELLTEESGKKIIYKESHIAENNLKLLSKEFKKHDSTDKSEKSNKKGLLKQEGVSEEFIEKEKKMAKNLPNHIRKRNNSIEEFISQKVQILEDRSKKELQLIEASDKHVVKSCSAGTCACHKTHNLGKSMKLNSKSESTDKLKVQSPLKETCFDYKTKILAHIKSIDTHLAHEIKKKIGYSNNCIEKQQKVEGEQSRKRRNSEDYSSHKIRVVEEPTKKETKSVTHVSERTKVATKEHNGYFENKKLVSEKSNLRDSGEKSRKNSFSKADYSSFGRFLKKEEKQASDSKGDLALKKAKNSEHSNLERLNSSKRTSRSKEEHASVISKEHPKNEIKKILGSGDKLKDFTLKKVIGPSKAQTTKITKKEIENGTLSPKVKGWEKSEEKEKKHNYGKIPRRYNECLNINVSEAISPVNYKLKEISDAEIKKKQCMRVTSESPNVKRSKELIKSGGIMANKKEDRCEMEVIKREKEIFSKQGNLKKDKKEVENDSHQRIGRGQTRGSNNHISRGLKEDVYLSEFNLNANESEKMQSATLLAKLIKKTKKLSWSLLKEP